MKLIRIIFILLLGISFYSCNSTKFEEKPIDDFIGLWEIQGREMFNGIEIRIEKNDSDKLIGRVTKLNDNKYIKMFVEINDIWVSEIKRSSNFEFKLIENKIGRDIFSLYGQETTKKFNVQFISSERIGLETGNTDPIKSKIIYKRIDK